MLFEGDACAVDQLPLAVVGQRGSGGGSLGGAFLNFSREESHSLDEVPQHDLDIN